MKQVIQFLNKFFWLGIPKLQVYEEVGHIFQSLLYNFAYLIVNVDNRPSFVGVLRMARYQLFLSLKIILHLR